MKIRSVTAGRPVLCCARGPVLFSVVDCRASRGEFLIFPFTCFLRAVERMVYSREVDFVSSFFLNACERAKIPRRV